MCKCRFHIISKCKISSNSLIQYPYLIFTCEFFTIPLLRDCTIFKKNINIFLNNYWKFHKEGSEMFFYKDDIYKDLDLGVDRRVNNLTRLWVYHTRAVLYIEIVRHRFLCRRFVLTMAQVRSLPPGLDQFNNLGWITSHKGWKWITEIILSKVHGISLPKSLSIWQWMIVNHANMTTSLSYRAGPNTLWGPRFLLKGDLKYCYALFVLLNTYTFIL